jgi:DNA-binding MarR family transcriptional regulator
MGDTFTLEKSIGYVINKTAMKLKTELLNSFRYHGFKITTEQWAVLICLREIDGKTQSEIAEKLIKDKTNLSRILDGMEKREWIVRSDHENDRRSYRIFITEKGNALVEELIPIARRINKKSTHALAAKDILELERLMTKIYKNLE